jgi:serine/threonine protein kinase
LTGQIFARKIVRTLGFLTDEECQKEVHAINIIRQAGPHPHIIHVLEVSDSAFLKIWDYSQIDSELCSFNLQQFLYHVDKDRLLIETIKTLFRCLPGAPAPFDHENARMKYGLHIFAEIASGLSFVHDLGLTHRDVKPSNGILISSSEVDLLVLLYLPDGKWKMADFGLTEEGTTRKSKSTKHAKGTASYRAPELAPPYDQEAKFNQKVDIWAMGCILYEIIFQRQAFDDDYGVTAGTLKIPTLPVARLDPRSDFVLQSLPESLFLKQAWKRPTIRHVLGLLSTLDLDASDVRLIGCSHEHQNAPQGALASLGAALAHTAGTPTPEDGLRRFQHV